MFATDLHGTFGCRVRFHDRTLLKKFLAQAL